MHQERCEKTGISYLATGPVDAPLVLCLHGFPDIPRTWDALSETLAHGGFRVIAPWLPGYAPSPLDGPLDLPAVARRLSTFVDEVSSGAPVRLVGHDWGALIVYCLLAQRPDRFRAAVTLAIPHPLAIEANIPEFPRQLLRSSYIAFFQLPAVSGRVILARNFAFIEWLWKVWSPGFNPGTNHFDEVKRCLKDSLPSPLSYYRSFRSPRTLRELRRLLNTDPIPVPTLFLHGERDGCTGVELAAGQERYFSALFETIRFSEAGHFLHLERPAEINQAIQDWFQAH